MPAFCFSQNCWHPTEWYYFPKYFRCISDINLFYRNRLLILFSMSGYPSSFLTTLLEYESRPPIQINPLVEMPTSARTCIIETYFLPWLLRSRTLSSKQFVPDEHRLSGNKEFISSNVLNDLPEQKAHVDFHRNKAFVLAWTCSVFLCSVAKAAQRSLFIFITNDKNQQSRSRICPVRSCGLQIQSRKLFLKPRPKSHIVLQGLKRRWLYLKPMNYLRDFTRLTWRARRGFFPAANHMDQSCFIIIMVPLRITQFKDVADLIPKGNVAGIQFKGHSSQIMDFPKNQTCYLSKSFTFTQPIMIKQTIDAEYFSRSNGKIGNKEMEISVMLMQSSTELRLHGIPWAGCGRNH